MGAQIAAHFANAGIRTTLLDILPRDADNQSSTRNRLATHAIAQLNKAKPPPLMLSNFAERIVPGNLSDDLEKAVANSDLVLEAVVEKLDIKRKLMTRIHRAAPPDCIIATNTSGISISAIAEGLPLERRKRLFGMHFFNPPRFMHLLELIPTADTNRDILRQVGEFAEITLGKGVVICKDTPNFIGNRVGSVETLLTMQSAIPDYTIEEVDFLNGALMGRPKTGSFRLGDMVGLDIVAHVIENLQRGLCDDPKSNNFDPLYDRFQLPTPLTTLISRNLLGDKTNSGFYRKTRDQVGNSNILAFDLNQLEYREKLKPKFDELKDILRIPQLERRVHEALRVEGRAGTFLRNLYIPLFNYVAQVVEQIAETPQDIDHAICWGYGWKLGPFALWDSAGVSWTVEQMKAMKIAPATSVLNLLSEGKQVWYQGTADKKSIYVPGKNEYRDIPPPHGVIKLDSFRSSSNEIEKNATASLLDLGDGIACLEFRSKMNTLDEGVIALLESAPNALHDKGFRGLVIGNEGDDFCIGANLMQVMAWIMAKDWKSIESAVRRFQDAMMGLRHGKIPVIAAPFGRTLGGGTELSLHAAGVNAHAELYMGLVEIGVGLLPAGGGLKEICRRADQWAQQVPKGDPFPWLRHGFEASAMAKVSTSAYDAQKAGWLQPSDRITFHRPRLIADAKSMVISIANKGWIPPNRDEIITSIGKSKATAFLLAAQFLEWGGYATAHEKLIASKIAHILAGGQSNNPKKLTAQNFLDLEREAFVSLCGEPLTLARIQHMLQHGKPLRN